MGRARGFLVVLISMSWCHLDTSSVDPGHDGYIINCYLDNVKFEIRRQIGDEGLLNLPDIDFFSDKFFGFSGRRGTFENLADIYRVDEAKLTSYGNVTNIKARFYLPNAHLHYEMTTFYAMEIDMDVRVLINAVDVNFNYTKSGKFCSIEYNDDSLYISTVEGSSVKSYIKSLHNQFIPEYVAEYVETGYESLVELFVDTGLIFFVREGLTDYLYSLLIGATNNMNICDIFDGQAQCGSLTL